MHVETVKCRKKLTAKASAGFAVRLCGLLRSPPFGGFASCAPREFCLHGLSRLLRAWTVPNVEKQKQKLERMMTAMAKEQAKLLLAEREEQRRRRRAELKRREADRRADAHRKIELGGLVIAAGADEWNEAEIVGALLAVSEQLAQQPQGRERLRRKGLDHLETRAAARKGARS